MSVVLLLLLIPGITMGFFASEKTNGTQELLLTSPLTIWDIVLGKFVAGAGLRGAVGACIVGVFPADPVPLCGLDGGRIRSSARR